MKALDILEYPDPVLAKPSVDVVSFDKKLHELLDTMAVTMYGAHGIGLAGPQVGVLERVTVIDISDDRTEKIDLINPTIVERTGTIVMEEGCLSIPGYRDTVKRNREIVVKAFDRHGKDITLHAEGLLAVCIQHEIDHLDGVLFIDRLSRLKRELFKRWFKKRQSLE